MALSLCGALGGNTGGIKCGVFPGKIMSFAIWGGNLTANEYATAAAIRTALIADSKLSKSDDNKLFLFPLIHNREKNKEANTEQSFTDGLKVVTREGLAGYKFQFFATYAQCVELRKFNNDIVPVIVQDDQKHVWGTQDANNQFIGRQAILFVEGLDHPDDAMVGNTVMCTLTFLDPIETYDEAVFVSPEGNFQTLFTPMVDIELYEKATAASNVVKVSGRAATAEIGKKLDVYSKFSAAMGTGSLWKATNLQTNATFTITGVAANAGGYWAVTLDSTAHTALTTGDKILIENTSPTALDTAGAVGIETIGVIYTKP